VDASGGLDRQEFKEGASAMPAMSSNAVATLVFSITCHPVTHSERGGRFLQVFLRVTRDAAGGIVMSPCNSLVTSGAVFS